MTEIWQWNTATTAARVADKSVSAREVTDAHLARLDDVNPQLNAVTFDVREEAMATAAALDEAQSNGEPLGRLHGVPVTIKENIDVTGQPTPNGMPALADLIAPQDSPLVIHFKAAGAVIVGRTNTPEMSYRWHTDNPLRGETKNPWSANRTPGGSSGGAASSVAAGIGTIAHGNDLGGSVRQPSNACGLATIRPSLGRIAAYNPSAPGDRTMALQLMSVQGPIAREVADVRLGLEIMAQPDPRDPWHSPAPLLASAGPVRVAATYGTAKSECDAEVVDAIDAAARHLDEAGYQVEFVDPPSLREIAKSWQQILATETIAGDFEAIRAAGSDDFVNLMDWMFEDDAILDLSSYVAAYSKRLGFLRQWTEFLHERPIVLAPVSQRVPFSPNEDASGSEAFLRIFAGHTPLVAVNYLGLPAAVVPASMGADGPIGVQLIGKPLSETACLDAAAAIEARVGVMAEQLWTKMAGASS